MWDCPAITRKPANWLPILLGIGLAFRVALLAGQDSELSRPQLPVIETPVQNLVPVEYWIASSRECCQRGQTFCPQGTLRYFAADAQNRLTDVPESAFLGSLNYDVPVCFVIHGDMTSFENLHRAAPRIVKWLRRGAANAPVQIVFYTWPSDDEANPMPQLSITARGERAEFNGCYLAELISKFPAQARVSFFGHSFGSRVTAATLHLIAGGTLPGCQFRCQAGAPRAYRAVFIAAAMDRPWLNPDDRYGRALLTTEWLLNVRNGADFVINLYPIRTLYGRQALGRVGFSPGDRLRMGVLATRITEWDVTRPIGTGHAWANYYSRPEIAAVMAPVLVFSDRPLVTPFAKQTAPSDGGSTLQAISKSKPTEEVLQDSTESKKSSGVRSGL
jgi:hypothetical protein